MRSRRAIILAIALVTPATIALFFVSRVPVEPTYKGRTIAEWLDSQETTHTEQDQALISIGTNNLKLLLERISYESATDPIFGLVDHLPAPIARRQVVSRFACRKIIKANCALLVLQSLGPLASPAVPALGEMASRGTPTPATRAVTALGYIGESAVPGMASAMSSTNAGIRWLALIQIGEYTNSPPAWRAVTNALLDPDPVIRNQATQILSGGISE